jgi:hypothetical protein
MFPASEIGPMNKVVQDCSAALLVWYGPVAVCDFLGRRDGGASGAAAPGSKV